jgi:hypothetical protein
LSRRAGRALASAGLFAGLVSAAAPVASSAPVVGTSQLLAALHVGAPNRPIHTNRPRVVGLNQVSSSNWSGYADDSSSGNTYRKVSANWKQPTVTCIRSTDQEIAVFWVGIDGYSDATVEQDGTLAFCNFGVLTYYDWWEMYPTNGIQTVHTISAGDSMSSVVTFTAGSYKLTVTDHTNPAASFSITRSCGSCANGSAEWIAERPSSGGSLFVLPKFTTWRVSRASVASGSTTGTISTFPDDAITMINRSHQNLVTVSALNTAGNGFSATWHRSA